MKVTAPAASPAGGTRRNRLLGAAEPLRPHGARRSPVGPICALGSRAHADDGVLSVRPSEAAQRHLQIAAPSRSSSPQGQACSLESCKAAPGWLLPLSPTNGGSMRARRGHQARRSLTVGLRTPGPAGIQDLCGQLRSCPGGQSGHPYHLPDSSASPYARPTVRPPVHHRRRLRGDRSVASGSAKRALRSSSAPVDPVACGRHPASTESAADERPVVRTRCLPASHPPRRCPRKRSLPDRKPAFAASARAASWRPGR